MSDRATLLGIGTLLLAAISAVGAYLSGGPAAVLFAAAAAVVVVSAILAALRWPRRWNRAVLGGVGIVFVVLVAVGIGVLTVWSDDEPKVYRYFVASARSVTVLPVIAPFDSAVQSGSVLAQGESVSVECTLEGPEGGGQWLMLEDGTFVSARDLTPQYGGRTAPACQ